ncbi:MAG: NAD-dependent deacylase [Proteobacteria bacterium]|nr:NAD-dependent deacylase [Pseudomonadota bacterium]
MGLSPANVVVLTGAGISRSAGLPTYRGPGGLWSDPELAELATIDALRTRRDEVIAMFWSFRCAIRAAAPTAAHRALAAFEAAQPTGSTFMIVTQNIDGLHQAAGSANVCEYHGSLARWRCERCERRDPTTPSDELPRCCGEAMRPDIVLFGEMIPVAAEHATKRALRDCTLFVAIGTSGTVAPASSFGSWAKLNGAHTVLLNLEALDDADFDEVVTGPADEIVPRWLAAR